MQYSDDFLRGNNLIFTVYLDVENDGIVKASEAITTYKTTVERQCANAQQGGSPVLFSPCIFITMPVSA